MTPPPVFKVWRGEDWLAIKTAAFYPAEVAELLSANITESRWLEPDAAFGKQKRDQIKLHNRTIAKQGGEATAAHDDAAITKAMRDYKHSLGNKAGITACVDAVTTHLGYANSQAIWKRLRGKPKGTGICGRLRPSTWYQSL